LVITIKKKKYRLTKRAYRVLAVLLFIICFSAGFIVSEQQFKHEVYADFKNNASKGIKGAASLYANKELDLVYLGDFNLIGYCDCSECRQKGYTYNYFGLKPRERFTIAVDPRVIPLGSYVWINGQRYRAESTADTVKRDTIAIYVGSHLETYAYYCYGIAKNVYFEYYH